MDLNRSEEYLALAVVWMVHGVGVKTVELPRREEDDAFTPRHLREEVLLLVVVARRQVACKNQSFNQVSSSEGHRRPG